MFDRLGEALTVLRILQRLSQAELAQRAGIKATQVSRYETGQVLPQLPQLERLLDALEVGLPQFLYTLLHVERVARLLDDPLPTDGRAAESLVRHAVTAHWNQISDLHLRLAQRVAGVVEEGAVSFSPPDVSK